MGGIAVRDPHVVQEFDNQALREISFDHSSESMAAPSLANDFGIVRAEFEAPTKEPGTKSFKDIRHDDELIFDSADADDLVARLFADGQCSRRPPQE